ncbi:MAG: nitronate monooxygenase [Ferruginibacter sp.]|nr:nitronate monooxygenase [Ferruginibacter sp.]
MNWANDLTSLLKITYPVVQAPMLGVTTPAMVAAISNGGGLGSLPVGGLSPEKTGSLIRETKKLTAQPFAVNLFAHANVLPNEQQVAVMQDFLEKLCADNALAVERQTIETFPFYSYQQQIEILVSENISVVSFTFGILSDESIKALKETGTVLIGTATCLKEAALLHEKGIDIITAQGIEAGGHRGTFLENEPLPLIGSVSLVPEISSHINKPILAAGGIYNGNTIKSAFILGASGVQIGTAFIASDESAAMPSYKSAVQNTSAADSVLTRSFSGRWARGIRNKFITEVEKSGIEIPSFPVQGNLTANIRLAAQQQDNKEFSALWAGQSASKAVAKTAAAILRNLVKETEEIDE